MTAEEAYIQLSYYTLSHNDPAFIHQHIVDAYTAQSANIKTKPIALNFALIGLYLYLEKNYLGKEIQRTHTLLANARKDWPAVDIPSHKGSITVFDVLKSSPGTERDTKIKEWCSSVWHAYISSHQKIRDLTTQTLKIV